MMRCCKASAPPALTLSLLQSRITLRELLHRRIYEEVQEHNATPAAVLFRGFVTSSAAERTLNGERVAAPRKPINGEAQYARAVEAFARNGLLLRASGRPAGGRLRRNYHAESGHRSLLRQTCTAGGG